MTYITGWCGTGKHEGYKILSPNGELFPSCSGGFDCTCWCHEDMRKMRSIVEGALPAPDTGQPATQEGQSYPPSVAVEPLFSETPSDVTPTVKEPPTVPVIPPRDDYDFRVTPSGRRARGRLADEVKTVCDLFVASQTEFSLTPQAIAFGIDKDDPPSTGAVTAVLEKWEKIGYAKMERKPIRFVGYTEQGARLGLEAMIKKYKGLVKRTVRARERGEKI